MTIHSKMKIIHLITGLGVGGVEHFTLHLLRHGKNKAHHHVIFFKDGPLKDQLQKIGIPLYHVKGKISYIDIWGISELLSHIKKIKPDVIHSTTWSAHIIARCAGALYKIPVICSLHDDAMTHSWWRRALSRFTSKLPGVYTAVSSKAAESFISCIGRKIEISIIPNGVSILKKKQTASYFNFPQGHLIFAIVGRLIPLKRQEYFLYLFYEIFKKARQEQVILPPIALYIIGTGPQHHFLFQLSIDLQLNHLINFVQDCTNVLPLYTFFDALFITSVTEGMPMCMIEAMASGCPILYTLHLLQEFIKEEEQGIFLQGEEKKYANTLYKMIRTPNFFSTLKEKALKYAHHYSIDSSYKMYEKLYREQL